MDKIHSSKNNLKFMQICNNIKNTQLLREINAIINIFEIFLNEKC